MADKWHISGHSPVWGRLPPSPAISPSGNSKLALQFWRKQLETCSQEHKECHQDCPLLPTRVLDVGSLATKQHLKLFEPLPKTQGKYVALSYCWGDGNGLKATRSNMAELLQGIDEEELPATIRDAVELARCLGVQYLWVDALCIIQDDTHDWLHESACMSAVYAQAFLTISASSVSSSRFSFLHQTRGNKEVLFEIPENATSGQSRDKAHDELASPCRMVAVRRTTLSGFHQDRYDDIIDPTTCRAWTLQEHMLSTRLVSFSTDEVQWTCRTLHACECGNPDDCESPRLEKLQRDLDVIMKNGEAELGLYMNKRNLQPRTYFEFWCGIVESYCRRDLSWMRDKLPALSGVAYEFSQRFNETTLTATTYMPPLRYNAGLWDIEIHKGLLWLALDSCHHSTSTYGDPEEYRAPSWSWASVEGKMHWNQSEITPQAEILECVCALANPDDPFGQVVRQGTYLRVRATLLETQIQLIKKPRWATEYDTAYGPVYMDGPLVDVPLNNAVFGQHIAVAAAAGDGEAPDPLPSRTLQRRRGQIGSAVITDKLKKRASGTLDSEPDIGSGDAVENECPGSWEEANVGKQFTVWLLHVADDNDIPGDDISRCLVLGKPLGDEEVFERIGYLRVYEKDKALQFLEQAKSIITIV